MINDYIHWELIGCQNVADIQESGGFLLAEKEKHCRDEVKQVFRSNKGFGGPLWNIHR